MRSVISVAVLFLSGVFLGQCQSGGSASSSAGPYSSIFQNKLAASVAAADTVPLSSTYYFPHLAFGGGFQTTLTYVNYSPQNVSCLTTLLSDTGAPLSVPFPDGAVSSRMDNLGPGDDIHVQSEAGATDPLLTGWAVAQCTGPIKANLLYRFYGQGVAQGEAGVNAATAPATEFVTFAETHTGVAWANPSALPAVITITALSAAPGPPLGSTTITVLPNAHGAANLGSLLNLSSSTGSVQITSTVPIVSLSLNAEAFPAFSSLPPGDLPADTPLATATGAGTPASGPFTTTYYFPHLAFGGGFETTLTYVNYSSQSVSCETSFLSDVGGALQVPFFDGNVTTRTDNLGPGAAIHVQTLSGGTPLTTGWAQAHCTAPLKASLLYRLNKQGVPQGEAAVNAVTAPDTEFVTFAETRTGLAWANPSGSTAVITITALDSATGLSLASTTVTVPPNAHGAANIGTLLNLNSFGGSVQITASVPIVSLSLNAEAFPVFSSLPPGDLPDGTPLATGH